MEPSLDLPTFPKIEMKKILCLSLTGISLLNAQENNQSSPLDEAVVLDEAIFTNGNKTLVVHRIEEPELAIEPSSIDETDSDSTSSSLSETLPTQTFLVSATTYANQGTYFEVWPTSAGRNTALRGWSNLDWTVFRATYKFSDGQKNFQLMLFHSNLTEAEVNRRWEANDSGGSYPRVPEQLPTLQEQGGRYLIVSPEEDEHKDTMAFLEGIHGLYDERTDELREEYDSLHEYQEERKRQLSIEAAQPQTRLLRVWRRRIEE